MRSSFLVLMVVVLSACTDTAQPPPVVDLGNLSGSSLTLIADEDRPIEGQLRFSGSIDSQVKYSIVSPPSHGQLDLPDSVLGLFRYTPEPDWNGTDEVKFEVTDGNRTGSGVVTLVINPVNDAPKSLASVVDVVEDTVRTGTLSGSDVDNDALVFSIVSNGSKGAAVISNAATGAFTYTPNADVNGADSFSFKVSDGKEFSEVSIVTVSIAAVNDAPTASNGSLAVVEDTVATGALIGTDKENSPLVYSIVANGAKGTAVITNSATGAYTYTPSSSSNGSDSFTFRVSDGTAFSNTAAITVSISPVNDGPVVVSGSLSVTEDTSKSGVLAGSDIDSASLTFSIVSSPTKGSVTISNAGTGAFTYTPNSNANGTDSFTFKANDGALDSNIGTMAVVIAAVNDAPVSQSFSVLQLEDTAVVDKLLATDVDGDALTYSIVSGPSKGSVAITNASTGNFTYTPNPDTNGTDSFSYKTNDGKVDSNTAVVTVNITAVNDAPVAQNGSFTTAEDTVYNGTLVTTDLENDPIDYTISVPPTKGAVVITDGRTGAFRFTPLPNANGSDSFKFQSSDGRLRSNIATFSITITPVNDAPTATAGSLAVTEDQVQSGSLSGSDIESSPLTYSIVSAPSKGTITLNATTGVYQYTPSANLNGADSFTFKVNDGALNSAPANIQVSIAAVNDVPTATPQSVSTNEDTTKTILLSGSDVDGDTLTFSITTMPAHGTLVLSGASVTYRPELNYFGADRFLFAASDGVANSAAAVVNISVAAVNDAPLGTAQSVVVNQATEKAITIAGTDIEGDFLTFSIVATPAHGTLSGTAPNFIYAPEPTYVGTDSFTFVANDGVLLSPPTTVTISIRQVYGKAIQITSVGSPVMEQDSNGKILVCYVNNGILYLARYTKTLTLDATFGTAGQITMVDHSCRNIIPYRNGSFFVSGSDGTGRGMVSKYLTTGQFDTAFVGVSGDPHPGTVLANMVGLNSDDTLTSFWPGRTVVGSSKRSAIDGSLVANSGFESSLQHGMTGFSAYRTGNVGAESILVGHAFGSSGGAYLFSRTFYPWTPALSETDYDFIAVDSSRSIAVDYYSPCFSRYQVVGNQHHIQAMGRSCATGLPSASKLVSRQLSAGVAMSLLKHSDPARGYSAYTLSQEAATAVVSSSLEISYRGVPELPATVSSPQSLIIWKEGYVYNTNNIGTNTWNLNYVGTAAP